MPDTLSAKYPPLVSREQAGNAVRDYLRLMVGRGRRFSVLDVHKATGVPARLIECAMCDPVLQASDFRALHTEHLACLARFFGADFTNAWLGLARQGAFDLPDDEPNPGDFAADTSDDTATVVRAAVDGVFDKAERKVLPAVGARMMKRGAQLVALKVA